MDKTLPNIVRYIRISQYMSQSGFHILFSRMWTLASTWGHEWMKTPDASPVAMETAPPPLSEALL